MTSSPPYTPEAPPAAPQPPPVRFIRRGRLFTVLACVVVVNLAMLAFLAFRGSNTPDMQPVQGEGFTVSLPGEAKKEEGMAPGSNVPVMLHSVQVKDEAYIVGSVDIPAGTPFNLSDAMSGAATAVDGRIVSEEPSKLAGHKARDAVVSGTYEGEPVSEFLTVTVVGKRMFTVQTVVRGADQPMPEMHRRVRDSFRVS